MKIAPRTMRRRGWKLRAAILCLVLLTAGPASAVPRVQLGREFTLPFGQTVVVSGERLSVTFTRVVEDSRCPTDVNCVWEGNAQIAVTVSERGEPKELLLNTNSSFPTKATYLNYVVRLVKLDPHPAVVGPVPERDYRATLVVTKNLA